MPNMLFANNCNTTLNGGITAVATSMVVTSATGFPAPTGSQYFYCTLADAATQTTIEIVKVTAVSGTTFTIVRGQDGTTGTIFSSGAVVSLRLVRANLNDFPKLDETNTFTADQAITGQLTTSAGLATTSTFTATPPADGLVMDYATGYGRFSAFAGDGFQWYNAGVANTKLMQLSSTGAITTATWNGATVGVAYGGTGLTTLTANYIPYGNGTSAFQSSANFTYNGTTLAAQIMAASSQVNAVGSATVACSNSDNTNQTYFQNTGVSGANNANLLIQQTNRGEIARFTTTGGFCLGNTTDPGAGALSVTGNLLVGKTSATDTVVGAYIVGATGQIVSTLAGSTSATNSYTLYSTGAGAYRFYVDMAGTVHATSIVITAISDERLKENIKDIDTGLDAIMALKPRRFDWKEGKGQNKKNAAGFIAQEFETVFPECVGLSKAGVDDIEYKNINYETLIPTLVKAIQELKAEINSLK